MATAITVGTTTTIVDPKMMIETMEILGVKKARLPNQKLFPLAILAGVYVGIGAFLYITLTSEDHSPPTRILGGLGFSTALILIIFVGAELFTGNCMILMSVLVGDVKWHEFLLDLIKVWCGNFFGCLLFAVLVLSMGLGGYDATVTDASDYHVLNNIGLRTCAVAYAKGNLNVWEMFTRGILANMCVCLAVLQALASKSPAGKVLGVIFPICAFVVFGLEHSIANQFIFSLATMYKCNIQNHGWYWLDLILSTVGNMIGAFFLSGMYYIVYLRHVKEERMAGEAPALPKDEPTYDHNSPTADGDHIAPAVHRK